MRNAKELQHNRQYGHISIQHDLTKKQSDKYQELKAEAREVEEYDMTGQYRYRVRGPPGHWQIVSLPKNY